MRKWRCPKIIFLPILILGFFSITYSARADTATINAALGDGDATYSWGGCNQATWSQIRNISSASSRRSVSGERFPAVWAGQCANGVDVVIRRAFFPFDTSALPDGAVVTAATLNIYVPSVTNALNDGNDFLSVVKSNQASTVTLLVTDYRIADFTEGSSRIDISSISPGSWVSLPLNAAGRSWVSTTGNTMLAVLDGHDILDIYNPAGGQNQVGMRFANYGLYIPYLQITYTVTQSNGASFVSQIAPPLTMAAGTTANVSVTMQNTGTATWTQAGLYRLGSQNPLDNNTWGLGRVDLPVASVAPGSSATFNFTVTAPSTPGTYNFQWRMVQEGVEWFGANSTNVSVTVSAPADTTPPTPPTVSLGSATQNSLTASWSGATDNVAVTGYRLDVSTSAAFGTFVSGYNNLDVGNVVSRLISGLSPSTTYYARTRAYDAAGNTSANSNVPSLATIAPPPPPNVSGYAWADDIIGWIKMSGTAGDSSPYGVFVSSASPGVLSGYAWANPNDGVQNHIGWIDFGPVGSYPVSSFVPAQSTRLNRTTGLVSGWARVCSVFASGCSGALKADSERGGWDGWIGFGTGGSYTQPVTVSGCNWSGYAWGGGTTIGWIHFGGASYPVTGSGDGCAALPDLTAGTVSPTSALTGTATTFSATVSNTGAGATGAGFTNLFQFDNNADHTAVTDTRTDTSPAVSAGGTDVSQVSYTFPTAGTWYVRACADNNASFVGTIAESSESNNCGAWTPVEVALPILTGTFSASPDTIDPGNPSTLTWTSNATTCTGAGFSTGVGSPANGNTTVTPLVTSPYQITCTRSGYAPLTLATTITVISVTASINAKPSCISGGGSSKVSWSASPESQIASCTISSNPTGPGFPITQSTPPFTGEPTATVSDSKYTFTIACTTTGGATVTKSTTVDVRSCWTEF